MINSLTQYFAQNGQLILPNIGMINYHKVEAVWVNSKLVAPKETILFEATDSKPSKQFYHFLGDNLDISYEQAIVQFDQFLDNVPSCNNCKTRPVSSIINRNSENQIFSNNTYYK